MQDEEILDSEGAFDGDLWKTRVQRRAAWRGLDAAARQARIRATRLYDGVCLECGGKRGDGGDLLCWVCRERANIVATEQCAGERERLARDAAPRSCRHCGDTRLNKRRLRHGRPYYSCRACGRYSPGDGVSQTPAEDRACPYCGGPCRKDGHSGPRRRQVFHCARCARHNTLLWPSDHAPLGGPFPHDKNFCLNRAAEYGLIAYCQAKKMSVAEAVRDILCRAAVAPLLTVATIRTSTDWDGIPETVVVRPKPLSAPEPLPPGPLRFPDLRPEATRKFGSQRDEARFRPTVLVTYRAHVRLNDAAMSGLLRVMRLRGLNHQEAARALLAEARG